MKRIHISISEETVDVTQLCRPTKHEHLVVLTVYCFVIFQCLQTSEALCLDKKSIGLDNYALRKAVGNQHKQLLCQQTLPKGNV